MANPSTASTLAHDPQRRQLRRPSKTELAVALVRRFSLEAGPTLVFATVYVWGGILWATAAYMVTTALSIVLTWLRDRRLPIVPFLGAGLVVLFGLLTLVYDTPSFIQVRPTVVNGFLAVALLGSLVLHRNLLKLAMREELALPDAAWRRLAWRLALFLLFMAALNEVVRLSFSVDVWVAFKALGLLPLNVAFGLSQLPTIVAEMERAEQSG